MIVAYGSTEDIRCPAPGNLVCLEIGLGPGPRRTELLGNGELGNMVAE